jgi:hypothetical protein
MSRHKVPKPGKQESMNSIQLSCYTQEEEENCNIELTEIHKKSFG